MQDDLGGREDVARWQALGAAVDQAFAAQVGEPLGSPLASLGSLDPRLVSFLASPEAASPIDQPIDESFAALLGRALGPEARLGLGPGDRVGAYLLEGVLGEGGMGTVFLAQRADGSFEQQVALKVLHRGPADEGARRRFLQERQILARLRHPHIARLLDGGLIGGIPYLVLEHIDGPPLTTYCDLLKLGPEERIRLLLQACDAVRHAHSQGVIHRDLKPSNLLVEKGPDGTARVAVLDFGIARVEREDARVTITGQVFGTPGYMAPEQASGDPAKVDRRADVYALGVLLYELLSGHRPLPEAGKLAPGAEPLPLHVRLPGVPRDLATITETCLLQGPEGRYASVRALMEDLERYLDGRPIAARPISWPERWWRRCRRHPGIAILAGVAVATVLVSGLLLASMAVRHARDLQVERNAAIDARIHAEEMLGFMLEDLHGGLERVGRLDLLESVARRALDYYDDQDDDDQEAGDQDDDDQDPGDRAAGQALADSSQKALGRAKALFNAGDVLEKQAEFSQAIKAYESTHRTFVELVSRSSEPIWRLELARSHWALAGAMDRQGDAKAADHALAALALSRQLGELEHLPVGWEELHFEILALGGWVLREARSSQAPEEALALLREALRFASEKAGGHGEAEKAWRHRRAVVLSYLGLAHGERGDLAVAVERFLAARELCEDLLSAEPANTLWREELQLVHARMGYAYLDLGDLDAAAAALKLALQEAEHLVRYEPSHRKWQRELGVSLAALAAIHRQRGELGRARARLEGSLEVSRRLAVRFPTNSSARNDLAWDLLDYGRILRDLGDTTAAHEAWEEAVAWIRPIRLRAPENAYYLDTEAQILLELGRRDEAAPLVTALLDLDWAAPDFLDLAAAHGLTGE